MSKILSYIRILIFILPVFAMSIEIDFDIDKSVKDANKTHKHIILFIHKDNCGYCERMEFLIDEKDVLNTINKNFILLDINRDDDKIVSYQNFKSSNKQFIKALDIDFFPTLVFIDTDKDKIIHWELGYRNKEKFIRVLEYISTKSYIKKSLEDFKDERFFDE